MGNKDEDAGRRPTAASAITAARPPDPAPVADGAGTAKSNRERINHMPGAGTARADAISAGRPGARAESIEKYIERINALESISSSYEGVNKAFAMSAGREVRVIVEPTKLMDSDLPDLAKNIAKEIQESVAYPGRIKVNVIRRTQNVDYANKVPGPTKRVIKK
jgi:ribonuclease Y